MTNEQLQLLMQLLKQAQDEVPSIPDDVLQPLAVECDGASGWFFASIEARSKDRELEEWPEQ